MSTTAPLSNATTAPPTPTSRHFNGLDSLRAASLIAVMAFHVAPTMAPGGFIGVDVFFVLSGFLITTLLLREHQTTGTFALRAFAVRRARRLLPAALVMVTVMTLIATVLGGDLTRSLARQVLGVVTLTSNWEQLLASHDYFAGAGSRLFDNCWSLAVEEQFYLFWPLVLLAALRWLRPGRGRWALVALLASTAAVPLILTAGEHFDAAYLATPAHAFGLAVGATIAVLHKHSTPRLQRTVTTTSARALLALGALALVGLALLPTAAVPQNQSAVTLAGALAGAALVIGVVHSPRQVGNWLERGPWGWLGRRSYGVYLWHFPLIVIADAASRSWSVSGAAPNLPHVFARLAAVVVAVLAGAASLRWVEAPIRAKGFRASLRRPAVATATLAICICICAAVTLGVMSVLPGGAPSPSPGPPRTSCSPSALHASKAGAGMVAIGDSVMLASACGLRQSFPGITIDAVESRQLIAAPNLVRRRIRSEPSTRTVILGLGVNGVGGTPDLEAAIRAAGHREVVLVTVSAPVAWQDTVNTEIRRAAAHHSNVRVADWHSVAQKHPNLIAPDGIHPGPAGGERYAAAIRAALRHVS
ncbi:acyltransferase [Curtobacterium flaccumfaciens pv. betae]|uniref:acyltransferase family protein n=1 Tax=Curtobacterium flaccumfaciens TaxID=2035 RepID=UPI0026586DFD|nr:acyltransferase family protein [Curtobacterium flaccumfaciens]MCS5512426.1 acyltransferase [Curtobacterium flaccumfaciens pv. betae]